MRKKHNIKGIIFDFDDVLANSRPGKEAAMEFVAQKISDYLKKQKLKIETKEILELIRKLEKRMVAQGICNRNFWWSLIFDKFLVKKPPKTFLNYLTKKYWEITTKKSSLYKETIPILNYLKNKNYLLGLLSDTDGTKGVKQKRIKILNLEKWFDAVVIAGEETKKSKPDPEPFHLICKKLNLGPNQCVYIGDHLITDILGAKKAGMMAIWLNRGNNKSKIKPHLTIKNPKEIKRIFNKSLLANSFNEIN
jgi:putative hydrolase of the HAD superfamily